MNIETVNELIASLESAGELSIREQKFLKLAKAYRQLAAENVALKDINAWCKTDAFKNMCREFKTAEALGCSDADCMHDAMLVAIMHAPATPATERIYAEAEARGVEKFAKYIALYNSDAEWHAVNFAKQLRVEAEYGN
ncbi:hypothetical protein [Klebsiella pneumoniae]|uniref:hypothetical protein n=1 Tax=Klebsiella pneumoniae TaxID=573 RepID=UPI0038602000